MPPIEQRPISVEMGSFVCQVYQYLLPGCGKRLYHYDVERGECFQHSVDRTRRARGEVFLSTDHVRTRTRDNARAKAAS